MHDAPQEARYLLRPALALERLSESSGGQLLYELVRPRADGATHLLLDRVLPVSLRKGWPARVDPIAVAARAWRVGLDRGDGERA